MARAAKVFGFWFMLFLLLSVQPAYADERSFQIGEVEIHASVDSEGNMRVEEVDNYHFDGAFNGIVVELDSSKSDGIVDFQAFEVSGQEQVPLRSELSSNGDKLEYKVYSQSQDESKVFQFTYIVKNVVQVYADTAELYWKFFDSRNPSELGTVIMDVELPGGVRREEITAFGHGPTDGVVQTKDNGVVRYEVSPLPSETLLEVRVLFPGSYVPGSTRVSEDAMLEAIMEEERIWAEGGGDDRSVYGALALLIANLAGGIYLKYGNKSQWKGKYYRELPGDITPAIVGYLKNYKTKPRDLMATMVDLVRKRHVQMEKLEEGGAGRGKANYSFQLQNNRKGELRPHEELLIEWFFQTIGNEGKVTLADIRDYTKDKGNKSAFRESWGKWKDEVAKAAESTGYIAQQVWLRRAVQLVAVTQFFGIMLFAPTTWNWLMFCAIPLVFLIPKRLRKTREGQTEYAKWKAFGRFLRDYSQIASREPMAVNLWAHYFVYAVPLGAAKKMNAITRLEVPGAETQWNTYDDALFYHHMDWSTSIQKTIDRAIQRTSSEDSSDGSFSSGGGSGGGGGGRGAF